MRILLIEDNPQDAELLRRLIPTAVPPIDVVCARSLSEAFGHLALGNVDVILTDLGLPGIQGLDTFDRVQRQAPGIPIVVLTGTYLDEPLGLEAVRRGAQDYLIKGQVDAHRLVSALRYAIERKRLETRLQQSNEELDRFAHTVSHDLKQPLRTIFGFVQLLSERCEGRLGPEVDHYLATIRLGTKGMQATIDDLLAYARAGLAGVDPKPVSAEEILGKALASLQAAIMEAGASITHDPLPIVPCDEGQMVLLFQNLLDNAIKFRGDRAPRVHVSVQREGPDWTFAFRDNGIGIPPGYQARIFGVFERLHATSKYPGSGLGLAICKRIAERHGGRIWVVSKPGEGATFHVALPAEGLSKAL